MGQSEKSSSKSAIPWKEILSFTGMLLAAYIGYLGIRSQIEIPIRATQTAEAKLTSVAQTAVQPTSTDFPVPTPTTTNNKASLQPPIEPTASPSPTNTTAPSSTATPIPAYACATVNEQPQENSKLKREQRFKVSFTIVNTGTTAWPEDLVLNISSNPYGTVDASDFPMNVRSLQPGGSINMGPFDAKAPDKDGHYVIAFKLGDGLCWPYIAFDVGK